MMSRMMTNDSISLSGTTPGVVEVGGSDGAGVIIKCILLIQFAKWANGKNLDITYTLDFFYYIYNGVSSLKSRSTNSAKKQTMLLKYNCHDPVSKTNTVRELPLVKTRYLSTG